uniref:Regulator of G protein signaling 2 n=1 Tax=Acanthochromis polyacanthus TaxID=80966 RepID=A0A3Q1GPG9_9TELE
MRGNLTSVSSQNMAFSDCMKPTELPADKKGIKRKNWRNRIRFLLKSNSSPSILHLMRNRPYRPSADDVNQWAQSLDKLLSHKYGKAAFCIFLKSEFCEENIEFWTACEDFKTLTSHKDLVSKANNIYEEFIKNEAPKEVTDAFSSVQFSKFISNLHTALLTTDIKLYLGLKRGWMKQKLLNLMLIQINGLFD